MIRTTRLTLTNLDRRDVPAVLFSTTAMPDQVASPVLDAYQIAATDHTATTQPSDKFTVGDLLVDAVFVGSEPAHSVSANYLRGIPSTDHTATTQPSDKFTVRDLLADAVFIGSVPAHAVQSNYLRGTPSTSGSHEELVEGNGLTTVLAHSSLITEADLRFLRRASSQDRALIERRLPSLNQSLQQNRIVLDAMISDIKATSADSFVLEHLQALRARLG